MHLFCIRRLASVDDSCEVVSCIIYADYYHYISKCKGVRWAVGAQYVCVVVVYTVGWGGGGTLHGVRPRVLCGRCDARQDVSRLVWHRCGLFPIPTVMWGDPVCNDGVTLARLWAASETPCQVSPCPMTWTSQLISRSSLRSDCVPVADDCAHWKTLVAILHFRTTRNYASYRRGKGDYMSKCSWHHRRQTVDPPCASGIAVLNICAWSLNKTLPPESYVQNMSLLCLLELCLATTIYSYVHRPCFHCVCELYTLQLGCGTTMKLSVTPRLYKLPLSCCTRQGEPVMGVQRP